MTPRDLIRIPGNTRVVAMLDGSLHQCALKLMK
jgi:hypothetical protein